MRELIKKFFAPDAETGSAAPQKDETRNVRVATCALFLAMAESDDEFSPVEYEHIISALKKEYGLTDEYAE